MSTSPESQALLSRAAELRAAGQSWDEVATQLAVTHDELRKFVAEQNRDYERLARRARADVLQETRHLALRTLRELMASSENRVRVVATTTFVRYDLALKRHGTEEAESRLERDTSPHRRDRTHTGAEKARDKNMSESTEVKNQQHVAAPKNAAQSGAQSAPQATSASGAPTPPAPAKTAPPAQPKSAATVAATPISPGERERRKRVLLNDFALGTTARPLGKDNRLDREVTRIVDGLLTDAKVDDAPPG